MWPGSCRAIRVGSAFGVQRQRLFAVVRRIAIGVKGAGWSFGGEASPRFAPDAFLGFCFCVYASR
jgi:hypothetical protein